MDNEAIRDLLMTGSVTEVIGSKARVTFPDRDNFVSAPLQVLQLFTYGNKSKGMPKIGAEVVCMFLPTGLETGFIIGSIYRDGDEEADDNSIQFEDGSLISFKDGQLNINMINAINLIAPKINLNGAITGGNGTVSKFSGGIDTDKDVVANGVSLNNHTNGGYGVDK